MLTVTDFRHVQSIPSWLELDHILTGSEFANLRRVDLDFHFFSLARQRFLQAGGLELV